MKQATTTKTNSQGVEAMTCELHNIEDCAICTPKPSNKTICDCGGCWNKATKTIKGIPVCNSWSCSHIIGLRIKSTEKILAGRA